MNVKKIIPFAYLVASYCALFRIEPLLYISPNYLNYIVLRHLYRSLYTERNCAIFFLYCLMELRPKLKKKYTNKKSFSFNLTFYVQILGGSSYPNMKSKICKDKISEILAFQNCLRFYSSIKTEAREAFFIYIYTYIYI